MGEKLSLMIDSRYEVYELTDNEYCLFDKRLNRSVLTGTKEECQSELKGMKKSIQETTKKMSNHPEYKKEQTNNAVNKPNHYIGDYGLEVEEILQNFMGRYEDSYVAHRVASTIEYLLRSPLKNGKQDIEKAQYNLKQALEYIDDVLE